MSELFQLTPPTAPNLRFWGESADMLTRPSNKNIHTIVNRILKNSRTYPLDQSIDRREKIGC